MESPILGIDRKGVPADDSPTCRSTRPDATLKYLVYTLSDPRDGRIRYVGITEVGLARPKGHGRNRYKRPTNHYHHWINSLRREGLRPRWQILFILDSPDDLDWIETSTIKIMKESGYDLVNSESGGRRNKQHSEATKEKQRIASMGNIPWNKGKGRGRKRKVINPGVGSGNGRKNFRQSEETKLSIQEGVRKYWENRRKVE